MTEQTAERALPYLIKDADEHSTPKLDADERYIDPHQRDMARGVDRQVRGVPVMSYNGRPARFTFENYQVVGSNEQLADVGVQDSGAADGGQVIPGSLLTRVNALNDL